MRKSQEIEEDITKWFETQNLELSIIPINNLLLEHRESIRQEAKKEVFDDVDSNLSIWILKNITEPYGTRISLLQEIDKLKQRHLSNSKSKKGFCL